MTIWPIDTRHHLDLSSCWKAQCICLAVQEQRKLRQRQRGQAVTRESGIGAHSQHLNLTLLLDLFPAAGIASCVLEKQGACVCAFQQQESVRCFCAPNCQMVIDFKGLWQAKYGSHQPVVRRIPLSKALCILACHLAPQ